MIVTVVTVYVKKEHIDDFIKATVENHSNSVQEKGNLRFDVLQSHENPCIFTLYEAYETEESSANHKKTGHYLKWNGAVAGWMDKPRTRIVHRVIAPAERGKW